MIGIVHRAVLLAGVLALCGCASTSKPKPPPLTGNLMVDGPNAIASGPTRDRVLWQYRTAAALMRQGKYDEARGLLDDALTTLRGVFGPDESARKARSYFQAEAKKTFIGEPYERSMAYIYRGILYWMDGELDNARACFRSAQFEDSDTENKEYAGDWVLPDYLSGLATTRLGGDGTDDLKRATASAKGVTLPPYQTEANTLFLIEFGPGPVKFATGEYGEELRFRVPNSRVRSARITVGNTTLPVAATDDVGFQATTRGGRVMDHILGNKAVFKSTTDTIGNVAIIGGLSTAVLSGNRTAQGVGLGIAVAGVLSKVISAATVPAADTRSWDNLPQFLSFARIPLAPGAHTARVEFLDAGGQPMNDLTKTLQFTVEANAPDKVLFVSDTSLSPLTL